MDTGLSSSTINQIQATLKEFPEVEEAILYGSRAKGNYRPNSDIDLTLVGEKLDFSLLLQIEIALDDLLLPYKIDLSLFSKLYSEGLIDHIKIVGVKFYEKLEVET